MKKIIEYFLAFLLSGVLFFLIWSKSGAVLNNLGNYYYENSAYKKALKFYNMSIKVSPNAWMPYLGLANTHNNMGDYDMAVREYKHVLQINPLSSDAVNSLARIYTQKEMYEEALAVLRQLGKTMPGSQDSLTSACFSYIVNAMDRSIELFVKHKNKEAISVLSKPLKQCEGPAIAYYTLGLFYLAAQDYKNAEDYLNKALMQDQKFYSAYKLLGGIYFDKGNFDKAALYWRKAINENNRDAASYNDLGIALMNLERYEEAITFLEQAIKLDPQNKDYIYSLASVYRDNKRFEPAISEYLKLNNLQADYPGLHNDLGDIYRNLGREKEAVREFKKEKEYSEAKLAESNNNPVTLNDYAYALNSLGAPAKALEAIERVIASYPKYRQAYLTKAKIYENQAKPDLALQALRDAKQISAAGNFINIDISRIKRNIPIVNKNTPVQMDAVYLKNGREIQGKIKKEEKDKLTMEIYLGSTIGEVTFYSDAIERIEKGKAEAK